jgi:hypothetical protein
MTTDNTAIAATNWIDKIIKERGIEQARQLMTYNVSKNPYFRESNYYITIVWQRINEIENNQN